MEPLYFKMIGPYILLEEIGQGGMGTVYRAIHSKTQEEFALKLSASLDDHDPDFENKKKHFLREIQVFQTLHHPNIRKVHSLGWLEKEKRFYLVMDYIAGHNLRQFLIDHPSLSIEEKIHLFCSLVEGVAHLHEKKIVHRDIKPSNILVSLHRNIYLSDFGGAYLRELGLSSITDSQQIIGTLLYLAPECLDPNLFGPLSDKTDIYSLSVILYEIFTGKPPLKGSPQEIVIQKLKFKANPFPDFFEGFPPFFKEIYIQMSQFYPEKRPSAKEILELLESQGY
ncbi:MAG: serine/threonine protein kinase [Planctomycetota bacterium]|nr:MAG: serine/threonine protein kinase [Planctomycetota bacterium]